jgi:hypothetical protein
MAESGGSPETKPTDLIPKEADWALHDQLLVEPEPCDDGMHYAIHGTVEGLRDATPFLAKMLVERLTEADLYAVIEAGTKNLNPNTHTALSACHEELLARLLRGFVIHET